MGKNQNTTINKLFTIVLIVLMAGILFLGAIAVPLSFRGIYSFEIRRLKLEEKTKWTYQEMEDAYNEMMDFCMGKSDEFGTGVLRWSEDGKSHFADCKKLFLLDIKLFEALTYALLIVLVIARASGISVYRFKNKGPGFYAGTGLAGVIVLVAFLASLNFDKAFEVFHKIFFPGKDNWLFDPYFDQIINILPEEFFRDCAIIIGGIIVLGCAVFIALGLRREKRKNVQEN